MKNYILLVFALICLGFTSCEEDKKPQNYQPVQETIIPFAQQYPIDIAAIDKYLDEYCIESVSSELSISFQKIPSPNIGNQVSIRNQTTYPLKNKIVTIENVAHKIYYLSLRNGTQSSCTNQSKVICSYNGLTLENNIFDTREDGIKLNLPQTIKGWQEIIPLFKSGNYTLNSDSSVNTSTDFGAGVMFLPSALGYYNQSPTNLIQPYSPLIFSFKLRHVE